MKKIAFTLFSLLLGCSMTSGMTSTVNAADTPHQVKPVVTNQSGLASGVFYISKEATPTTIEVEAEEFPTYKSIIEKYSPAQRKKLLNILNSKNAKEAGSIEELSKIIGDENLKIAIQKDLSNSSQASRFPWSIIIQILIYIINNLVLN